MQRKNSRVLKIPSAKKKQKKLALFRKQNGGRREFDMMEPSAEGGQIMMEKWVETRSQMYM